MSLLKKVQGLLGLIKPSKASIGGRFYLKQYRDGNRINAAGEIIGDDDDEDSPNLFIDEGLIYALNAAFGVSVGGAPTPYSELYIGLGLANRAWNGGDVAATINTIADEFELYDEATRPAWAPQSLASAGDVQLSDGGFEATFTISDLTSIGGSADVYSAFLITASAKDGSGDVTAKLMAGSNFTAMRTLYQADVFKVGYILQASSAQ